MSELSANTNLGAMASRRYMERNNRMSSVATQELASGRITYDPSRAPSEAAVESRLEAKISNLAQATKNASQLTSMIQMGAGALKNMNDIVTRLQALTTQANSDGIDDAARLMLDQEAQQLLAQMDFTAQTTRWGNQQLFNGSAASTVTNLGAVTEALSVTAVATAFTGTYNATNTQGVIDGTVTDADVTKVGSLFRVTMVIGGKTYSSDNVAAPTAAGVLTLVNKVDGGSVAFNYHATDVSAFTGTAANFKSLLRQHVGVDTGSKAVGTSGSIAMYTNATVAAGSAAASGTYGMTYTVAGGVGTFMISDGKNISTANVTASNSITGTVTVGNFTLTLAAFDGSATLGQAAFNVTNNSSLNMTGQIETVSSDTLTITFDSMNTTSLGLSGGNVKTKSGAASFNTSLQAAAATLSNAVATLGGKRSQLDFQIENLKVSQQNQAAAKSSFADTNIAASMAELVKYKSLSGISQSVFSQAIQDTQKLSQLLERL